MEQKCLVGVLELCVIQLIGKAFDLLRRLIDAHHTPDDDVVALIAAIYQYQSHNLYNI